MVTFILQYKKHFDRAITLFDESSSQIAVSETEEENESTTAPKT